MASHSALRAVAAAAALVALTVCGASAFVGSQPPQGGDHYASYSQRAVAQQGAAAAGAAEGEPMQVASSALRAALAIMAALAVAFVPMDGAEAARSGGRMGGGRMGGRSAPPPPRAQAQSQTQRQAMPSAGPTVVVAPSPFGYGFGSPFGFGMPLFGPPILPIPFGGNSANDQMLKEQQNRDERVIDQQNLQIQQMQKELAELKAKKQ